MSRPSLEERRHYDGRPDKDGSALANTHGWRRAVSVQLVVEGLAISRGGRKVFEGLGFEAAPGAFVEFRGANGSGKTSLLRALAGFLWPSAGKIRFSGVDEPMLALHYVGHGNGLKGAASVLDHARYWAGLLGGEVGDAIERVGLSRQADLPARVLSQGQARRLALARLLVAPRPVWLLDEPAAALDASGCAMLGGLVAAHRAKGGLVLAALHDSFGPTPTQSITLGAA